ncbi:hypothetical protein EVAR_13453_1 [Eumeta japonica]|uniref:Uncharacterized protein n=1 Tax=Eumeta variegata TaxID=151549 RepID=A0A4C1UZW0_EUMVA|nr:hypothetical protein EVAR_13453_1 [Eumeta japonica]
MMLELGDDSERAFDRGIERWSEAEMDIGLKSSSKYDDIRPLSRPINRPPCAIKISIHGESDLGRGSGASLGWGPNEAIKTVWPLIILNLNIYTSTRSRFIKIRSSKKKKLPTYLRIKHNNAGRQREGGGGRRSADPHVDNEDRGRARRRYNEFIRYYPSPVPFVFGADEEDVAPGGQSPAARPRPPHRRRPLFIRNAPLDIVYGPQYLLVLFVNDIDVYSLNGCGRAVEGSRLRGAGLESRSRVLDPSVIIASALVGRQWPPTRARPARRAEEYGCAVRASAARFRPVSERSAAHSPPLSAHSSAVNQLPFRRPLSYPSPLLTPPISFRQISIPTQEKTSLIGMCLEFRVSMDVDTHLLFRGSHTLSHPQHPTPLTSILSPSSILFPSKEHDFVILSGGSSGIASIQPQGLPE